MLSRIICLLYNCTGIDGGLTFIDKVTFKMMQCEERVPDALRLLLRLRGSPRQQRRLRGEQQVRGGAKLAPGPSVKARPWPKAKT